MAQPEHVDVVVVGNGLAGTIAALAAAHRGAKVALVGEALGRTAWSAGVLELGFATAIGPGAPLDAHITALAQSHPHHPFGRLGSARAFTALQAGHQLLRAALEAHHLAPPALDGAAPVWLWPTDRGEQLPAAQALPPHAGLRDAPQATCGVVRFGAPQPTQTEASAQSLRPVTVPAPTSGPPLTLARALEDAACRAELMQQLRPHLHGLTHLWLPPCLGLSRRAQVTKDLEDGLGLGVSELCAATPGVPGVRLHQALRASVCAHPGIRTLGRATAVTAHQQRVHTLTADCGATVAPGQVVWATGRLFAGGLVLPAGGPMQSAVLDLPVSPCGPEGAADGSDGFGAGLFGAHPAATAGVATDAQLRPWSSAGPVWLNVWVAGSILGGAPPHTHSADGIALATGALAGHAASGDTLC